MPSEVLEKEVKTMSPIHPGKYLKTWLMDRNGITENDISNRTEIPISEIKRIISGGAPVNEDVAYRLVPLFGRAAETMLRMQYTFDHYVANEEYPAQEELPRLSL